MSGLFRTGERVRAAKLNRLAAQAAAALPDAPADGGQYVRQDGAWVSISGSGLAVVQTVSTTTHTPTVGVVGRWFICTNASGCTVTVPTFAAQAFPVGTVLTYQQNDTDSAVIFNAAGGVTINRPAAYQARTAEQFAVVQLVCTAENVWTLYGHLLAA